MYNQGNELVSFRGAKIPEISVRPELDSEDNKDVIDKILSISKNDSPISIDSVHFNNGRVSHVKLTTGDIVTVETAIALAQNNLLKDYSSGSTMKGGRTLRSKPNIKGRGIYQLPRF